MSQPLASVAESVLAGRFGGLRRWWRSACAVAFCLILLPLVPGRLPLPDGSSVGFKSFARNVAIAVVLGALLRVDGLRWARSRLIAPLLTFAAIAWVSVLVHRGLAGDARLLLTVIGLFYAARLLVAGPRGDDLLFHWLGGLTLATVLIEVALRPALLTFDPLLRTELRFTHPNSLGGTLALLLPVFGGAIVAGRRRGYAALYGAVAILGVALSFSRSALLASALGLALVAIGQLRAGRARRWLVIAVAGGAAAAIVYLSLNRGEADSQRLRILAASLSLFDEHRVLGIGYGIENLRQLFPPRYIELYGQSLFLFHSHNLYVETLVGTGVVGAIAFVWLLARVLTTARATYLRARTTEENAAAAGFLGSVAAFLLLGFTDSLFYQAQTMTAVAVVWALMDWTSADQGGKSTDQP